MRFSTKVTALAIAGAIALFGGSSVHAESQKTVTLNPGDTLDAVAMANGSDYIRVFNANPQIANPNVVNAGDQVRVPAADEQLPDRYSAFVAASTPAPVQQVAYTAPQQTYYQQPVYQQRAAAPVATPAPAQGGGVWDQIAQCESGGNWNINTGNGYSGGLQFAPGTWAKYGDGSASAAGASKEAQIAAAEKVLAAQGWGAWPSCSAKAGLR